MEKIELVNHDLIVDFDRIEGKINEIIDYLNTQPQAEERKSVCDKHHREICEDCMRNGSWTFESTPEEKEGWEFDLRNLMYRDGEQLRCAGEGKPYTGEYRELVISMVKNLLSEREREVLNSMREWVLDKLNK